MRKKLWQYGWIGGMMVAVGMATAVAEPDGGGGEYEIVEDSAATTGTGFNVGNRKTTTERVALTGLVYDIATSKPLAGAKISLRSPVDFDEHSAPLLETETDASGHFRIADILDPLKESPPALNELSEGDFRLMIVGVEAPGHLPSDTPPLGISAIEARLMTEAILIQQATDNAHFPVKYLRGQSEQHVIVAMTQALTVSGRVVNESGVAIPHAYLRESDLSRRGMAPPRVIGGMAPPRVIASVGDDGTFQFLSKPLSSYFLVAEAKDYAPSTVPEITILNKPVDDIEIVLERPDGR